MKFISLQNYLLILAFLTLTNCATHKKQISSQFKNWDNNKVSIKEQSNIYLIGDAGNSPSGNKTLQNLEQELKKEGKNSSLIFLGDNVYPKGVSNKDNKDQVDRLNSQLNILKNYKGQTIFIPGNHDWYYGLDGLKTQEKLVEKALGKNTFLPENGCPLEVVHLNKNVDVIVIDSQWYITNWNHHPEMNDKCDEIKTRDKFFVELEGLINKSQEKVTLIAIHHPVVSRGTHGGQSSVHQNIFPINNKIPLPGLGTLAQTIRKSSGLNPQDLQGSKYNELVQRVSTLAKEHDRLIFVSGHDHNLQYLFKNGMPQIISGAGSKSSPTYLGKNKGFTFGQNGYAKLSISKQKQVTVAFKSDNQTVFETEIFPASKKKTDKKYNLENTPAYVDAFIYNKNQTDKNKAYQFIWGNHYRNEYSKLVNAKTVLLDTLYGGLTLVKKGGGHQSKSLRLVNPDGKQYVMRALKKSAVRFLQTVAFQNDYIANDMEDTYTENILYDFYTSAHPYTPFIIGDLSDPIGVYHTNPKLFYVPKQDAIRPFDDEFGDALYMIEERPEDGHTDLASFGKPDDIISTDDLFAELRESKNHKLDEKNYVTARLFDMILGDWDRHVDQWRWAVFKDNKHKIFRPIPRDRDQAFSNYDGLLLTTITTIIDPIKLMQTYKKDIRNLFKFNDEPYPIDVSLLQEDDFTIWNQQATFIKNNLTDKIIDDAFNKLPKAVQNKNIEQIKSVLKYRRDHVEEIASEYRKTLEKFAIIKGTDKDEWFDITADKYKTTISVYNLKDDEKEDLHFTRSFNNKNTKEIWVYGLDDDDKYQIKNVSKHSPKIRLIGGQNNDTYTVENAKNIVVHDFKSKNNTFHGKVKKHLTDQYNKNTYQYRKVKDNTQTLLPLIAYNPDDGVNFGASITVAHYGFNQQPFTNKHSLAVKYYSATTGFDITHSSEFATYYNHWNVFFNTRFTSSNFSNNFFGFGNNTINIDNDKGLNYNRVKTEIKKFEPGFVWDNLRGANFKFSIPFKIYEIEEITNRYLNTLPINFDEQNFIGANTNFSYQNYDSTTLPTLGFSFNLNSGWDYNLSKDSSLGFIKTSLGILHPLSSNKKWIIASKIRSQFNLGNQFQLYQAAFIGGNNGLRGFRNERFAGKRAYSQNTDIRYTINRVKTAVLPITYGVSAGYDYGRVWLPSETSDRWHNAYGGSFWVSIPGVTKANFNLFNSKEGARFTFGVGVNW
ncbi:putative phosphodiesterase [Wenyingzhuangia heitensis]|uniref:Phosphodiesterase n=1 Tax=Wenyingzhuangia heitensis TaxID=1487859 RepID=A0ABX0UBI5_9FLAO|nr:metallophosphoesterase [Wenyingzhuangia heitensis]NIJ44521.1 putative phosphodiesterase [Wenyingzhuangia heitensis]